MDYTTSNSHNQSSGYGSIGQSVLDALEADRSAQTFGQGYFNSVRKSRSISVSEAFPNLQFLTRSSSSSSQDDLQSSSLSSSPQQQTNNNGNTLKRTPMDSNLTDNPKMLHSRRISDSISGSPPQGSLRRYSSGHSQQIWEQRRESIAISSNLSPPESAIDDSVECDVSTVAASQRFSKNGIGMDYNGFKRIGERRSFGVQVIIQWKKK